MTARGVMTTEFVVWCGQCSAWERYATTQSRKATRVLAKRGGWVWGRDYGYICKQCFEDWPAQ